MRSLFSQQLLTKWSTKYHRSKDHHVRIILCIYNLPISPKLTKISWFEVTTFFGKKYHFLKQKMAIFPSGYLEATVSALMISIIFFKGTAVGSKMVKSNESFNMLKSQFSVKNEKKCLKSIRITNLGVHFFKFRVKLFKIVIAFQNVHKAAAIIFPIFRMATITEVVQKLSIFQCAQGLLTAVNQLA